MENRKLKMAFVDLSNFVDWPMGGMLEYELRILNYLTEEYEIDLWGVSVDDNKPDYIEINNRKYKINIFGNVKTKNKVIPNYWRGLSIIKMKKEFLKRGYDIIYTHLGSCCVGLGGIKNKPLLVYHQHGLNYLYIHSLMLGIQKPFYWISQRISDLVFLVSDDKSASEYAFSMKNKSKAKFVGVGSPIDLSKFDIEAILKRINERKSTSIEKFIYTGRVSEEKQVTLLVRAFGICQKKTENLNSELIIVGDGPDMSNVKNEIEKSKNPNIKLLGRLPHEKLYGLLLESDVFLTASTGEGCSVSVLEGMASGLPVVCFSAPGLKGQIDNGITGIVVENGDYDDAESLADGMVKVEKEKNQMAHNCLKEVQKYDEKEISKKIITEINACLICKNNGIYGKRKNV